MAIGLGILVELDSRTEAPDVIREQIDATERLIHPIRSRALAHGKRLAAARQALDSLRDTRPDHPFGSHASVLSGSLRSVLQSIEAAEEAHGWHGEGEGEEGERNDTD